MANARADNISQTPSAVKEENPAQLETWRWNGTLNTSNKDPESLGHIVLRHQSHPLWDPKREIFCRGNLDLLPGQVTDSAAGGTDEIQSNESYPLFLQVHPGYKSYMFRGYYKIRSIKYLAPHSRQLNIYLEAKFQGKPDISTLLRERLNRKWAVVTLQKDRCRDVEAVNIRPAGQRGVNNMLAELRRH
ncbi:hypothetical protein FQN49_001241 [Arthroderma sp. PD_2]|nr:hypothetical protein FQN49_001241 [Arthroderma sp. PD_2]